MHIYGDMTESSACTRPREDAKHSRYDMISFLLMKKLRVIRSSSEDFYQCSFKRKRILSVTTTNKVSQ